MTSNNLGSLLLGSSLCTLVLYVLRGFGLLGFLPGGVILFFLLITILIGVAYGLELTKNL